ncbi:MAG: exonuclease SbcCD subunit D [candidate division Zixibacteria bacterium]|nr:exonuclease SbcCD subunit D [candidate division Zixibacteria bacterium]
MRICHFADSHLGAGENHPRRGKSGLTLRQEDMITAFCEAVDKIIRIKPDLCIHAGDLFHSVRPINRVMAIAGEQFYRLAQENGIPTVIIGGNHDTPKQPHLGSALEVYSRIENLHIAAGGEIEVFEIGDCKCHALPHCLTTDAQNEQLTRCLPDPNARYNVLIAHGVAAGMREFSMADLGEQELPLDILDRFDYAALGHFHNFCQVSRRAFYAGSTERLSQSERTAAKGFAVVDLEPFRVSFHEINCRQMVDIAAIDATGKRGDELARILREQIERVDAGDKIVRVSVTGVSEETLKTIPAQEIAALKQNSFALDIRFEKEKADGVAPEFGRSSIGRLDVAFVEFLDTVELEGFDRQRLKREALQYLAVEE